MHLTNTERITILMRGYGDKMRSHQDVAKQSIRNKTDNHYWITSKN